MTTVSLDAERNTAGMTEMTGMTGLGAEDARARELSALDNALDFTLAPELEATEPPEARGDARDDVRLMVSSCSSPEIIHTRFSAIGAVLRAGDALVINTSGVLNAALTATRADGARVIELHLSTRLPGGFWTVEPRLPQPAGSRPLRDDFAGETLALPGGATATLHAPYPADATPARLWLATLRLPLPPVEYTARYGFPIRYGYVPDFWPNSYYQTVYATEMGSAEMPSAGRAFTRSLMADLVARGVLFAPLLLHTGVSSLEAHEPPYEEYYRVPAATARLINATRAAGGRIIAVGTTAVRALETVADTQGEVHPGEGWTGLVVTPERGIRAVDGLLTGLHEPRSSHLAMLEALVGREHLTRTYGEAISHRYLWHEFGDLHLMLP
ncbi:MAG TPA: S-adenosylmethionine:tRNA ribosyltransferase-isomerase [Ktedonobacterales bacterium]|nr:S-adenosylmethionine:tRNA ribosyltransferase-isomerase [Ktedonobacterales bacterium]